MGVPLVLLLSLALSGGLGAFVSQLFFVGLLVVMIVGLLVGQ